jgi:hypothetical protein
MILILNRFLFFFLFRFCLVFFPETFASSRDPGFKALADIVSSRTLWGKPNSSLSASTNLKWNDPQNALPRLWRHAAGFFLRAGMLVEAQNSIDEFYRKAPLAPEAYCLV